MPKEKIVQGSRQDVVQVSYRNARGDVFTVTGERVQASYHYGTIPLPATITVRTRGSVDVVVPQAWVLAVYELGGK